MGITTDPNDPELKIVDPENGQQMAYLVLSDEERAQGFVQPVRTSYVHDKCGSITTMNRAIAETYARNPRYYGGTYCAKCQNHFPVGELGEFTWDGTNIKVGTFAPFGDLN
ncbi:MAG TPA: hypothetical protein VIY48_05285 [Candidatus Paceibacterota bacterium]